MRGVTTWLWAWSWFRYSVLVYVRASLPGYRWVAFETPLMYALHQYFLSTGDYAAATAAGAQLRAWESAR